MDLPTGTVTFLFTDIEGSTRLWQDYPEAMRRDLARHDELLHQAIEARGGYVFKTVGDAFCAAFASPPDAVAAALTAQRSLQSEPWPDGAGLRVRMAIHTGISEERDGDYFGLTLNRVARLLSAAHGGQALLSLAVQELARDYLPAGVELRDMGEVRLKDLGRPDRVFQLAHPDLPAVFPPLRSLASVPNNLPQQTTSLVGREKEIAEVTVTLENTCLLTLTGAGGAGKTRLSLQVAADVLEDYPDGVWLVELASLSNPILVPQAAAQVLGVREEAGIPLTQTLTAFLHPRKTLLVLDNCEHLIGACADLVTAVLRSCPGVRILASSREPLGIAGEQAYRVPSLSLPDPTRSQTAEALSQYEAVRLFIERAKAVQPAFRVTDQNAPAAAQVCFQLDGIPLAIELAAARVRSMPIEQINARLNDRFRLLTGGSRTALPRQQTLRAMIDWSHDLLSDGEKTVLRRLSVFVGGWALEAAEAVCSGEGVENQDVLDLLTSLLDKSLAVYAEQDHGRPRYRLLETVRQYANERLVGAGEAEAFHRRHGDFYLDLAEEAAPHLNGREQRSWLDRLEAEHDNLRAALDWFQDSWNQPGSDLESSCRLAEALTWFWFLRAHWSEGRARCDALLAHDALAAPKRGRAAMLMGAGTLAGELGDRAAAQALQEESARIYGDLGDARSQSHALMGAGDQALIRADFDTARSLFVRSLALSREVEDLFLMSLGLVELGLTALYRGQLEAGRAFLEEGLPLARKADVPWSIAWCLTCLGMAARLDGDFEAAQALYQESVSLFREVGGTMGILFIMAEAGRLAAAEGEPNRAARLLGAAERQREVSQAPAYPVDRDDADIVIRLKDTLGMEAFTAAWAAGRAMTQEEVSEYLMPRDTHRQTGEESHDREG